MRSCVCPSLWCVLLVGACARGAEGGDPASSAARFEPLASLPGMPVNAPLGLSGDGRVIVGYSRSAVSSAARGTAWVRSDDPAYLFSTAQGLEGEGAPYLRVDPTLDAIRRGLAQSAGPLGPAQRVLADVPMFTLGYAANGDWGDASATLRTSLLRAGSALGAFDPVWAGQVLPAAPPGFSDVAWAGVSLAGESVAGVARRVGTGNEPYLVLRAGVVQDGVWQAVPWLDDSPECRAAVARGVSADGTAVVGQALVFDGSSKTPVYHAFGWTAGAGAVDLGSLAFGAASAANDASADGRVIVGWSGEGGLAGRSATIWFPGDRLPRLLSDVLRDEGAYLGAWTLTEATAVSDDGRVVVGTGIDPEGVPGGWVAVMAGRTSVDFNRDGVVNTDDLSDYVAAYFSQPPVAGPGGFARPCWDAAGGTAGPVQGYQAGFSSGCGTPTPDDLGDFLTAYYTALGG